MIGKAKFAKKKKVESERFFKTSKDHVNLILYLHTSENLEASNLLSTAYCWTTREASIQKNVLKGGGRCMCLPLCAFVTAKTLGSYFKNGFGRRFAV